MNSFQSRCEDVAGRFLLSAVVIDDDAEGVTRPRPPLEVTSPTRRSMTGTRVLESVGGGHRVNSFDVPALVTSFAERGLICAVLAPPSKGRSRSIESAIGRADLVVLDWQIHGDDGHLALDLLATLLRADEAKRVRLVAIYTGEPDTVEIGRKIQKALAEEGSCFSFDEEAGRLSYGHCRIALYRKEQPLRGRQDTGGPVVAEAEVADTLIADFAQVTQGLLPSIALAALTAVRESTHRVLDSFSADLDPAFLAHRAALPTPSDSLAHVVHLLESELSAILEDATADESGSVLSPEALRAWLDWRFTGDRRVRVREGKEISVQEAAELLQVGLGDSKQLGEKDFKYLAASFGIEHSGAEDAERRLAWMFNFRSVPVAPAPTLQLGATLRLVGDEEDTALYVCIRAKCDCVRLTGDTVFPLARLDPAWKKGTVQLIVESEENSYTTQTVCSDPSDWLLATFSPDPHRGRVVAQEDEEGRLFFSCLDGRRFEWIGELRQEYAQRVVQHWSSELSRVAVDNSEWLRRFERSGVV